MPEKLRILFVDDDRMLLEGLRRMLRSMREEWDMAFANSPQEALELLSKESRDVIISDIRMPGMTGVELLEQVREKHPQTVRIVLSGQASRETVLQSIGPTHQYLTKPCDPDTLKGAIGRLGMLRDLLSAPKLRGAITAMEALPSLPSLYNEVTKELLSDDASIESVSRTIAKDVGLSSKFIQLVNSGFFGQPQHVPDPARAATILGLDTIKPLVLSLHVFSQFDESKSNDFELQALWDHNIAVGACSKRIAEVENTEKEALDLALMAGLLHDIGKVALIKEMPEEYRSALETVRGKGIDLLKAENETFGATHAEVGAYLLGIWGLPDAVVEAVAYHHGPFDSQNTSEFTPLTAVHAGNTVVYESLQVSDMTAAATFDTSYLTVLGLEERAPAWLQACQQLLQKEAINV